MLAVPCPVLDRTVLIWPSQILGVANRPDGIDVAYRCHCGALAAWRTGKAAATPHLVAHGETDGGDRDAKAAPLTGPPRPETGLARAS